MKETLKLALEAAEDFADVIKYDNEEDDIGSKACCGVLSYNPHSESCKAKQAITAIKAALAQPAQERNFCSRCGKRTADLTVIHTCTPPQENT